MDTLSRVVTEQVVISIAKVSGQLDCCTITGHHIKKSWVRSLRKLRFEDCRWVVVVSIVF